ncbi:Peptidoglycan/LPS O-acetylase OafA/YrhL, contains acyltransferase and SGNH-hydrolase domains [Flexibacter flexilis DSM 6793]|uniref:Peptidoglycan/LPS O-acetylase OafA/YrhL, contains acyltransferase and SGNH-hydrolase domains n=1 Tax=Flexibacter flexilis DSM 6793 TaxID=927664 RepID=A0A1I1FHS3_9BACT|nr:acyltransferase [Flexibacter flexilis]SFB98532.1 Peptidoglycan/LPS O-acetylase OafA/YrhL, contains acyltransferase and SGNH-hydrolase domains [Flexibacter flexilis DSM 6793]
MQKEITLQYTPALDSLRAWAVLIVIFEHYFQNLLPTYWHFFSFGGLGVGIFFTLSGFLITTILLQERQQVGLFIEKIKKFYFRRFLRLFPIYYLTILVAILFFPILNVQENIWYYLTYTTNLIIFKTNYWGKVGHFWSLAVEEQFYIVWPFFVLLSNNKWLKNIIISCIIVGVICKIYYGFIYGGTGKLYWILTPFNLDLLGIGALFAWLRVYKPTIWTKVVTLPNKIFLLCGVFLCLIIIEYMLVNHSIACFVLSYLFIASIAIIWILIALSNATWPLFLHNKVLQFLGRVSYGMYLYHLPIMGLWGFNSTWFKAKGIDFQFVYVFDNAFVAAFCCLLTTFVVSLFSYWLLELPINRLKQRL